MVSADTINGLSKKEAIEFGGFIYTYCLVTEDEMRLAQNIQDFDVYLELFNLFNDCLTDKENDLISRITKFDTRSNERQSIKKVIRSDSNSLVNLKNNYLNGVKLPDGLLALSL